LEGEKRLEVTGSLGDLMEELRILGIPEEEEGKNLSEARLGIEGGEAM
jgi:hypothetical protein